MNTEAELSKNANERVFKWYDKDSGVLPNDKEAVHFDDLNGVMHLGRFYHKDLLGRNNVFIDTSGFHFALDQIDAWIPLWPKGEIGVPVDLLNISAPDSSTNNDAELIEFASSVSLRTVSNLLNPTLLNLWEKEFQEYAKAFCKKTEAKPHVVISHEEYYLNALVAMHEAKNWAQASIITPLLKEVEELKKENEVFKTKIKNQ